MFRLISRVNFVTVFTWVGMTSEGPGASKTSSKVNPSRISMRLSILRDGYSVRDGRGKGAIGRSPPLEPPRQQIKFGTLQTAGLGFDVTDFREVAL